MNEKIINLPDIGGDSATVVEISVKVGDNIAKEDTIIVLESDKASMEIPASEAGTVTEILVKIGDSIAEDTPMIKLSTSKVEETTAKVAEKTSSASKSVETVKQKMHVPDIGADSATIVEILVNIGDQIAKDDSLITVESDKATMEIPSAYAGTIEALHVKQGDTVTTGLLIADIKTTDTPAKAAPTEEPLKINEATAKSQPIVPTAKVDNLQQSASDSISDKYHAGPAVRKLAREFGISLGAVTGTGPSNRILKEDLHNYSKVRLNEQSAATGIPAIPEIDFNKWGETEQIPQTKLQQIAANNFQRAWLNVPHVTQFEQADITDLEQFRKQSKKQAEASGVKLTPLSFIVKACAVAIGQMPILGASLANNKVTYKKYINIGIAVDTPDGLLVPVIKDADKLSIFAIAAQCTELATKARNKKLKPNEMQGGCFTISSLGPIGGTGFTPIVNAPEVAILGLSRSAMQPIWNGTEFVPRLMLPLCLSYDHRVINGVTAAQFTTLLSKLLTDLRNLLL